MHDGKDKLFLTEQHSLTFNTCWHQPRLLIPVLPGSRLEPNQNKGQSILSSSSSHHCIPHPPGPSAPEPGPCAGSFSTATRAISVFSEVRWKLLSSHVFPKTSRRFLAAPRASRAAAAPFFSVLGAWKRSLPVFRLVS